MVLGLVMLLLGANYLVESSVAVAKRAKLSSFIIGAVIVGAGTSAPEMFVSVASTVQGHGDLAIGNVVGSNICNTLLILGVTALIHPFVIERRIVSRDILFVVFISALMMIFASDSLLWGSDGSVISRIDAGIMLALFVGYLIYSFRNGGASEESSQASVWDNRPLWFTICVLLISLAVLLLGGDIFLDNIVIIAERMGVSESVISITVVAFGTSLPELITSAIAAFKGNSQLALGNVLGSNIFNILLILGVSSMMSPAEISSISTVDFSVMLSSAVLVLLAAYVLKKYEMCRTEGAILLAVYIGYITYLIN